MDRLTHLLLEDVCRYKGCLCPGGDAGSGLEAGCPEYGIFHSPGVAQRHGLTAVRQLSTLCLSFFFFNCFETPVFFFCRVPSVLSRAGVEEQSMSKSLFCSCQVRLHREAEELARLPEICPKRQHQF